LTIWESPFVGEFVMRMRGRRSLSLDDRGADGLAGFGDFQRTTGIGLP
jgi:hypothetical protein